MDDSLSAVFTIEGEMLCVKGHQSTRLIPCTLQEVSAHENSLFLTGKADTRERPDLFRFNLGPVSGGLLESVRMDVYTDGERMAHISPDVLFKNRQPAMKSSEAPAALLKAERINGAYSAAFSTAFCMAAEEIGGIEPPHEVKLARILMTEVERIANHIHVIAKLTEGASQNVAAQHLFALEERTRRIASEHFGHRYFFGVNGIGALERGLDTRSLAPKVEGVAHEFASIWEDLTSSRLFLDRLQTTCRADYEWMVGPAVRAADFRYDSRLSGYLPYSDLSFEVATDDTGDVLSRALVRQKEIEISSILVDEVCHSMKGAARGSSEKVRGRGWAVKRVETPGGDMLMLLGLADSIVTDFDIRSASAANLLAFVQSATSGILTDFTFGWESFGFWISELGGYS